MNIYECRWTPQQYDPAKDLLWGVSILANAVREATDVFEEYYINRGLLSVTLIAKDVLIDPEVLIRAKITTK